MEEPLTSDAGWQSAWACCRPTAELTGVLRPPEADGHCCKLGVWENQHPLGLLPHALGTRFGTISVTLSLGLCRLEWLGAGEVPGLGGRGRVVGSGMVWPSR